MSDSRPVMCTLTQSDLRDREGAWKKLLGGGLVAREVIPGGIRLRAKIGASDALVELIDLERDCCAWIDFEVSRLDATGETTVELTADGDGQAVLSGMFDPAGS